MKVKGQKKIAKVMGEFVKGDLRMPSGKVVKGRKQAVAIALSEAKKKPVSKFKKMIVKGAKQVGKVFKKVARLI